ncbi:flippase [Patescibacteria group bacterium]|nr:flippase [Patescibacteria group bacterium]MBU4082712.1 flippase [Patescibacteria group bacterium]
MLSRKIAYNTIISAGARIIGLALSLITVGLIARYLGQVQFGYYATILAFLYFFNVLADLGLYSVCLRDISRIGADEKKIVSNAFSLRFFAGLFFLGLAPVVVYFFPYPEQVKIGVLIGAIGFWALSNQQVLVGVFQKHLKMDRIIAGELLGRLTQLGLVVFFIWRDFGFLPIVAAFVGGALINFILVFLFTREFIPVSFQFDFIFWKKILKESLPLALAIVFTVIYFKLDTIMLSLMKSPVDVGIYNLSYKLLESLLFFPAMFVGLIMPLMSRYAIFKKDKFKKITQKTLDILLIFIFPMMAGIFFLSSKIVVLIGGDDFILSGGVLNVLIIAAGVIFLGVLFSNIIISLKKQKALTVIYGFGAIFNLAANFIFIPKYSYYGAAWTTVLTELIVTAMMIFIVYKSLNYLHSFKIIFKCAAAVLIMILPLYFLNNWHLFILAPLSALIYFVCLWLFKGVSLEEIMFLIKKDA